LPFAASGGLKQTAECRIKRTIMVHDEKTLSTKEASDEFGIDAVPAPAAPLLRAGLGERLYAAKG
jgi:hypothetical protein